MESFKLVLKNTLKENIMKYPTNEKKLNTVFNEFSKVLNHNSIIRNRDSSYRWTICFFFTFILIIESAFSQNTLDVFPIKIHFFGSVSSGKNIIAYGSNGSYLITTDKGVTWQQHSLNLFGEIRKMVNYNDTLWGIIREGYIIRSTDHGINWKKHEFALEEDDALINIELCEHSIYLRSLKHIFRINRDYNIQAMFTDPIIEITDEMGIHSGIKELPDVYSKLDFMRYEKNELFISLIFTKAAFLKFDEELKGYQTINLSEKLLTGVSYPGGDVFYDTIQYLADMFEYRGQTIFNIANNLYIPDKKFEEWSYFFIDTTFMNVKNPNFGRLSDNAIGGDYFIKTGDLFVGYLAGKDYSLNSDFGIRKYVSAPSNTFINYNNLFNNNFYTYTLYAEYGFNGHAFTGLLYHEKPSILEDTILVMTGLTKTLLQTRDDAKTWELISYFSGKPRLILNDSTYYFVRDNYTNINEITYSFDYGKTFRPIKIFNKSRYYDGYDTLSLFYMDKNGKGFCGGQAILSNSTCSVFITYDYGENYQYLLMQDVFSHGIRSTTYEPRKYSNVSEINDHYLIGSSTVPIDYNGAIYNYIYIIDTSFTKRIIFNLNSLYTINHIIADRLDQYYILSRCQRNSYSAPDRVEIKGTLDSGRTMNTILTINYPHIINQTYEHNKDSLFFACQDPTRIYLFDRKRLTIDTLYKNDNQSIAFIMVLSDEFYIVGNDLFLKNTNRNDLSKWYPAEWDYGNPSFDEVIFKGNVAIAKLKDDVRPLNYYRIMRKDKLPVSVVQKTEIKSYSSYLYAYPPFPLPATDRVQTLIYWDTNQEFSPGDVIVHNIYGEKVSKDEEITLDRLNSYSGYLRWDCSSVPNGVYLIKIHHGVTTRIVKAIVSR